MSAETLTCEWKGVREEVHDACLGTYTRGASADTCVNSSAGLDRAGVPDRHTAYLAAFSSGSTQVARLVVWDFSRCDSSAMTSWWSPGVSAPLTNVQKRVPHTKQAQEGHTWTRVHRPLTHGRQLAFLSRFK